VIRVRLQLKAEGPVMQFEIAEGRELAVLERAAKRIFPEPRDPQLERESAERFAKMMTARQAKR
jgi:hypothetical protein